MSIEFLGFNVVVALLKFLFLSAVAYALVRHVFKWPLPKWSGVAWSAALVLFIAWNIGSQNAPRFVLNAETPVAPTVGGEVKQPKQRVMSDEKRLQYNRTLNEENAVK